MPSLRFILTMVYDSSIEKIDYIYGSKTGTCPNSGESIYIPYVSGNDLYLDVALKNGYSIDTVTLGTVAGNRITIAAENISINATLDCTITTKQSTPQPTLTFKHFYDAGTIGSGTVKFRHYSQQEPSSGGTVEMPNISNWTATKLSGDFAGTLTLYTTNNDGNKIQCGSKGYEWITKINNVDIELSFSDVASVFGITQDSDGNNITSSEWQIVSVFDNRVTNDGLDGGSCIMQIDTNGYFISLTSTDVRVLVYDANTDTMRVDTCEIDDNQGYLTTKYAYGFNQIFCTIARY